MVVADAQVWFFIRQDNWTTVITTNKLWKNYYSYLYITFYNPQALLIIPH
jgi:hypothetical protein